MCVDKYSSDGIIQYYGPNPYSGLILEVSQRHIGTGAELSVRHFGTGAEVSETFRHRSKCKAYLHNGVP